MRLLGDRVLVLLQESTTQREESTGYAYKENRVTDAGIIVAQQAEVFDLQAATRGIVAKVGTKRNLVDLDAVRSEVHTWFVDQIRSEDRLDSERLETPQIKPIISNLLRKMAEPDFAVKVGDRVVFSPSAGENVVIEGRNFVILYEDDIHGVVEPTEGVLEALFEDLLDAVGEMVASGWPTLRKSLTDVHEFVRNKGSH